MRDAERCICCGTIIPEGRSVCPNCMVATKEMEIRKKRKKHWITVLTDVWYNFLCGWFVGMAVIGHWFIGLLVVFLVTDGNAFNWWCFAALALASTMLTFGILRYLGRYGKRYGKT